MNPGFPLPAASASRRGASSSWLLVGILIVAAMAGCAGEESIDAEQTALDALEEYEPVTHLDGEGHVFKLKLELAHVDDAVMDYVVQFTRLQSLSLYGSSVTDSGIAKLRELKNVEDLNIMDTRISDLGVASLSEVTSLRRIWLRTNDRLTPAGVAALEKALPWIAVTDMNREKR